MTSEAHRALEDYLPEGLLVYRYLSPLLGLLRIGNYEEHIASLGLSDFLLISASSFLTAPIRHAGRVTRSSSPPAFTLTSPRQYSYISNLGDFKPGRWRSRRRMVHPLLLWC